MIALSLLVGACGMTTSGQLTDAEYDQMSPAHHIYAARLDYNRLLGKVVTYASQPQCTEVVVVACSEDVVVNTAFNVLVEVDTSLGKAESMVKGVIPGDPMGLLGGSRQALATLSAYLVAKEIVK
jgi:hypothetical protein